MSDTKKLLKQLDDKYHDLGKKYTLTVAERDEYKKQRDQLMNHIKGNPRHDQDMVNDGLAKLLLIESFGLTEADLKRHLISNKDINTGREFLKSL